MKLSLFCDVMALLFGIPGVIWFTLIFFFGWPHSDVPTYLICIQWVFILSSWTLTYLVKRRERKRKLMPPVEDIAKPCTRN